MLCQNISILNPFLAKAVTIGWAKSRDPVKAGMMMEVITRKIIQNQQILSRTAFHVSNVNYVFIHFLQQQNFSDSQFLISLIK